MSADGRYVAFLSVASNLLSENHCPGLQVYVHDRRTMRTSWVSKREGSDTVVCARNFEAGGSNDPRISGNGQFITFSSNEVHLVTDDTNDRSDIFLVTNPLWEGPDTAPPVISSVQAQNSTSRVNNREVPSVAVEWRTDELSDSQVEYGPTTSYGSATPRNGQRALAHRAVILGLPPDTVYHYRVCSADWAAQRACSTEDFTFRTAAAPPPPPPSPPICSDSDGGDQPGVRGRVKVVGESGVSQDTCCNRDHLTEYVCVRDRKKSIFYRCADGCENGVCRRPIGKIPFPSACTDLSNRVFQK